MFVTAPLCGQKGDPLEPYVEFLDHHRMDPVDYVVGLFDEHDLVVIAERHHAEITQYDLFLAIVTDPRFGERAGHVYTEVGLRNLQPALDRLMSTPDLSRGEFRRRLVPLYRDVTVHPVWNRVNFFDFLTAVYLHNQTLSRERRVEIVFVDVALEWDSVTPEAYRAFRDSVLPRRDRRMAERILQHHRSLRESGDARSRGLVIMNYRHAFNDFRFDDGTRGDNVGRYLFETLPGRVANVLLNSVALRLESTDRHAVVTPIQEGRWDAAIRRAGVSRSGFDLEGTPFGSDQFDLFPVNTETVAYEDVFDGFVFYRHLPEHRMVEGVPGLVDDAYLPELRRRFQVVDREISSVELSGIAERWLDTSRYDALDDLEQGIRSWLVPRR